MAKSSVRGLEQLSDEELRDRLTHVDHSEVTVNSWEAEFLEGVLHRHVNKDLTHKQRAIACKIIRRYRDRE